MDAIRYAAWVVVVCPLLTVAVAAEPVPTPLQDDAALLDVQFASATVGIAVGDHGAAWRTGDGGQSWQFVAVPTSASLRSASFLTDQIGWVAGVEWQPFTRLPLGVLLKTVDGGRSWKSLGNGVLPGLEYVRFFDLEEGVVAGRATPACPSGVWTTTDGGETWKAVSGPTSPGWRGVRFLAPDLGIVAGAEGQLALVGGDQLLASRLPPLGNRTIADVSLSANASGWIVGEGGLVLKTTSGGVSWQTPVGPLPDAVRTVFDFRAVEQRGQKVWIAGAPGSVVWHSPDGGRSWSAQSTGQPTPINRLRFASDQTGVAVGAFGAVLTTRDGGATWQPVRGAGRRAALLVIPSRTRQFVPELLAHASLEYGYRSVVHVPVNTSSRDGFQSRDTAQEVLAAAVSSLGGSRGSIGRQLHIDLPGLDRDAARLQSRWQSQTEGRAAQTFVGSLVRELRMWRPGVVVIEEPAENDVYGDWVRQAVLAAVNQARDATRELDQFDVGRLSAWTVERVYTQLSPGSQGEVNYDLQSLLPRVGNSAQRAASPVRSLWEPSLPATNSLSFRSVALPQTSAGDLFAGLNLPPGSAARRSLGSIAEEHVEAVQKRLQRTRNLTAIMDKAERGSPLSAQVVTQWPEVARDWPAEQAAALLAEAAQRFRREAQYEHAEAVSLELVRRYPGQPAALDGLRWLLQYWTSAEVAWQRVRSRGGTRVQLSNNTANLSHRVEQASATGSGFLAAPTTFAEIVQARAAQTADRTLANRKPTSPDAPPDSIDAWRKRALDLAQQLEQQSPALFQQPEIQFPLAALKRSRGSSNNADAVYRRFQTAHADDAARQLVERELWLGAGAAEVPRQLIVCRFTSTRPHLDGMLSDPCWEQAATISLGASEDDPAAGYGLVMFAYDADFLYVAGSIPRHPEGPRDPVQLHERSHDADLSRHDWLGVALDTDRDYATWYEFRIDQRGWTSDRLWDDVDYDPKWYVAAEGDDTRWRIEAAIPFQELCAQPPQPREAWAVSLTRVVPALAQYGWNGSGQWPPRWSDFGLLRFEPAGR